jgi:hypothetical protein
MPTTTFRQDAVAGLMVVLNAYKTAHPTLLRGVYSARPDGPAFEKPCAYVGRRDEVVSHDSGIRTRTLTGLQVIVLDTFTVNAQTADRMDVLIDGLLDAFTAAPHALGGNSVVSVTSIADTEVQMGEAIYRATIFTFGTAVAQEGRL